jgi:hypothetical protein
MDLSLPLRFYTSKKKLQSVHFEILKMFFPDEKLNRKMSFYDFVTRIQFLVAANRKKSGTNRPAQRWQVKPHDKFSQIDRLKLLKLLTEAGYVDGMFDLGGVTHFDVVIIPGGRAQSQWRRLSLFFALVMSGQITFDKLVFGTGRELDEEKEHLSDFDYVQGKNGPKPPKGCVQYRAGYKLPTSLRKDDIEHQIMEHFWDNLDKPEELDDVVPVYSARPSDHLQGDKELNVLVVTIQPHRFHLPMYSRLAPPGSTVITVAPSALTGRHDNPYLCDGWARDALETYRLMRAEVEREIPIPA